MKKIVISLLLSVIFTFGATQGAISAVAEAKRNEDTPVAQIANDDYVPYNYKNKTADALNGSTSQESAVDEVTQLVKSAGGYVETYASESEYISAQNKNTDTVAAYAEGYGEEVKQIITVMTTATGSKEHGNYVESKSVANAIVRINGVPRYTDRNGQIKVTLTKDDYVELFVEKDGYNPYIEIMEVTGEEKVVHLKQPNDDIDIYAVIMEYENEKFNLITQPCYVNKNLKDSDCNFTVISNVVADEYYFMVNSKLVTFNKEGIFEDLDISQYEVEDHFSVIVEYNGILKELPIENLKVKSPEITEDGFFGDIAENNPDMNGKDDMLPIPEVGTTFGDTLKKHLFSYLNVVNQDSFNFSFGDNSIEFKYFYNPHEGTIELSIGYSHKWDVDEPTKKSKKKLQELKDFYNDKTLVEQREKIKQQKQELLDLYEQNDKSESNKKGYIEQKKENIAYLESVYEETDQKYDGIKEEIRKEKNRLNANIRGYEKRAENRQAKISDAIKAVKDGKKTLKNLYDKVLNPTVLQNPLKCGNFIKSSGFEIDLEIKFIGKVVLDLTGETTKINNIELTVGAEVTFEITNKFMVWLIPCFLTVSINAGMEVSLSANLQKPVNLLSILQSFELGYKIGAGLELGVGLKGVLSLSGYGKVEYSDKLKNLLNPKKETITERKIELEVGIKAQVLWFDNTWSHKEIFKFGDNDEELTSKAMKRSFAYMSRGKTDNQISASVLQNSEPQLVQNGNKKAVFWLEDSPERDDYNRTILKYSIFENGEWSEDFSILNDGKADFFPYVVNKGDDVFIVWQKSNRVFDFKDEASDVLQAGEIYFAHLDLKNNAIDNVCRLTENNIMDAKPIIAIDNNLSINNIYVVWQSNSDNNAYCATGNNSLYYRYYNGSTWSKEQKIYETKEMLSSISAAICEGSLKIAMVESDVKSDDIFTDSKLIVIDSHGQLLLEKENILSTEYVLSNGVPVTYCFDGENIIYLDGSNDFVVFLDGKKINLTTNYRIKESDNYTTILYNGMVNGKRQVLAAIYDKYNSTWALNIALTSESDNMVNNGVGYIDDNGEIFFIYNIGNDNSQSMNFATKTMINDFEITDYFTSNDIIEGDNLILNVVIRNSGDFPINIFKVSAFNQKIDYNLDSPLFAGEEVIVKAEFSGIKLSKSGYEEVILGIDENVTHSFMLNTRFADVSISAENLILNGKQNFIVNLNNNGGFETKVKLTGYLNGEIFTEDEYLLSGKSNKELIFDFDSINKEDYLYFVIETEEEDISYVDNSAGVLSIMDETVDSSINLDYNYYSQSLLVAKNISGV